MGHADLAHVCQIGMARVFGGYVAVGARSPPPVPQGPPWPIAQARGAPTAIAPTGMAAPAAVSAPAARSAPTAVPAPAAAVASAAPAAAAMAPAAPTGPKREVGCAVGADRVEACAGGGRR